MDSRWLDREPSCVGLTRTEGREILSELHGDVQQILPALELLSSSDMTACPKFETTFPHSWPNHSARKYSSSKVISMKEKAVLGIIERKIPPTERSRGMEQES